MGFALRAAGVAADRWAVCLALAVSALGLGVWLLVLFGEAVAVIG